MTVDFSTMKITALAGGVGGAKLAHGLAALLNPDQLSIIVNTGDDFTSFGLTICPDIDTVMYTLSGLANPQTGWGIKDDSFNCLHALDRLGGPAWFQLGDQDIATHLMRTHLISSGKRLTEAIDHIAKKINIKHPILPMCDHPYRTRVLTDEGEMDFQTYFVNKKWQPEVVGFRWESEDPAIEASPEVLSALTSADLIVICPSNPFVSIDPILSLPRIRELIADKITIGVSPIIGSKAVKGPAAKMFMELHGECSAVAVAKHYDGLLDGLIIDQTDQSLSTQIEAMGLRTSACPSLMPTLMERKAVAECALSLGKKLLI
jgi:LPPG:FO 2-phospho-L-lactate transferase